MTSGDYLSEEEKEKIRKELPSKSKRQLAKEMNRSRQTIYNFAKEESLED
jgi:IS30 family transposase